MNQAQEIQELREQIAGLKKTVEDLSSGFYKNNSSSTQVFNKDAVFNTRLRVPVFTVSPSVAEVGDLMAISGELYICTTASVGGAGAVWTVVGTQS